MTPVDQRIFASQERGDGHNGLGIAGDCFRACVASILNLDYHQVPHVVHYGDGRHADDAEADDPLTEEHGGLWWRRIRRWLRDRGMDIASWHWKQDNDSGHLELLRGDEPWRGDVILGGQSPRGPFKHVVVGRYWWSEGRPHVRVTHDPHPSRDGLLTVEDVSIVLDPYDPPPPDESAELQAVPA